MIEILTYLRQGTEFVPIDEFEGDIVDHRHVEGAIELSVHGSLVLDRRLSDYVDQLWAYIANVAYDFAKEGGGTTYFPDQPVSFSLRRADEREVDVIVEWADQRRQSRARSAELLRALSEHGRAFFDRMSVLVPQNAGSYEVATRMLSQAESHHTRTQDASA
jgi:hypothetical protein